MPFNNKIHIKGVLLKNVRVNQYIILSIESSINRFCTKHENACKRCLGNILYIYKLNWSMRYCWSMSLLTFRCIDKQRRHYVTLKHYVNTCILYKINKRNLHSSCESGAPLTKLGIWFLSYTYITLIMISFYVFWDLDCW